jgi:hypothetical protein
MKVDDRLATHPELAALRTETAFQTLLPPPAKN